VGSNEILQVDENLFDIAVAGLHTQDPGEYWKNIRLDVDARTELSAAQERGLLRAEKVRVQPTPDEKVISQSLSNGYVLPCILSIEITDACNLRCQYCSYNSPTGLRRGRGTTNASKDQLKRTIDWYLSNSNPQEVRGISFYGGEPLLRLEDIIFAIDYAKSIDNRKDSLRFHITTNGVLLTLETAQKLFERDVLIAVSLDGDAQTHDRYRVWPNGQGSFDVVVENIRAIWNKYGEEVSRNLRVQSVQDHSYWIADFWGWEKLIEREPFLGKLKKRFLGMSIDDDTRPLFSQIDRKPSDDGNQDDVYPSIHHRNYVDKLLTGSNNSNDFLSAAFEAPLKKIHNRQLTSVWNSRNEPTLKSFGSCVYGKHRLFVDLHGKLYPCERVSDEIDIGTVEEGLNEARIRDLSDKWRALLDDTCKGCWAIRFCSKCAATCSWSYNRKNALKEHCKVTQREWAFNLWYYCTILERNVNALDHLRERSIQKKHQDLSHDKQRI